MDVEAFRRVAALLPDAIMLVTADGAIKMANPAAGELLDRRASSLRRNTLLGIAGADAASITAYLRSCSRSTSPVPGAMTLTASDGQSREYRVSGALWDTEQTVQPSLIVLRLSPKGAANRFIELSQRIDELGREIRRRQHAESTLAAQEQLLRVTLESIGDCVITTNAAGNITFMNDVAQTQTGWSLAEAIGRPLNDVFTIIDETTRAPAENPASKVLREGKVVGLANHTILVRKDGSEQPIDDSAAPIRNEAGDTLGVVLVFRDITQRRMLEREVQQRADMLLNVNRRKDEFLAMLAHELRNPLAPLRNGVRILQQAIAMGASDLAAIAQGNAAMMERQVNQLTRLIDDLLDVARIDRGQITLVRRVLPLDGILERAIETVRPGMELRNHVFKARLPPSSVKVDADLERLAQVFSNILANAVKFTDPGGTIQLDAELADGEIAVHIRDTGIGMSRELIPEIFDLFTQGDKSLARPLAGLGIGLSVVRMLVDMHGGKVEAHSAGPGLGSEFVVRLPIVDMEQTDQPVVEADNRPRADKAGAGRKVLVVDDNHDAAETLAVLLRLEGYEVRTAEGAKAVIDLLPRYRPHIIVLDIGLPGMDGYALAKLLRTRPDTRPALLVAVTGYGQAEDRARAHAAGIDHHMTKPVDFVKLLALLAQAGDAGKAP